MEEEKKESSVITPSQYFDYLKGAKKTITNETIKNSYKVIITLAEKYKKLGQNEAMKKLCFLADTLVKEEKLIEKGINTFVYKDVIEDYIENVADKTVKIIELSRYMREVPDELIPTIETAKEIFDEIYVVFTDYTGKEERKIEKERRDKDPILFGVFKNHTTVSDRFYFLGDWVDEYCDLTLDKLVEEYEEKKGHTPLLTTETPQTSEELLDILKKYRPNETTTSIYLNNSDDVLSVNTYTRNLEVENKPSFFDKVRTIFKK